MSGVPFGGDGDNRQEPWRRQLLALHRLRWGVEPCTARDGHASKSVL